MNVNQALKRNKTFAAKQVLIKEATDARAKHFNEVAQSLGFANDKEAFKSMGKEFIAIARIGAPSINGI